MRRRFLIPVALLALAFMGAFPAVQTLFAQSVSYVAGDLLVAGTGGTLTKLPAPQTGQVLVKINNQYMWATLAATSTAGAGPVISGLAYTNVTQTSATILWGLNKPGTGQVAYGQTRAYGLLSTYESSFNYSYHIQVLSGLQAATTYHFRVTSKDSSGNMTVSPDAVFTTASSVTPTPTPTPDPGPAPNPTPAPIITSIAVSPSPVVLLTGATQNFTASLVGTGTFNPAVTWSAQRGSITVGGVYTAPSTPGTDVVTLRSQQDPTKVAFAGITVNTPSVPAPSISTFTPSTGGVGTVVTISGANFTGASAVKFNGANASSFTVASASSITATAPTGVTAGHLSVTTPGGTVTSSGSFTLTSGPVISGVTPSGITQTTAIISWNAGVMASGQVAYGPTTAYGSLSTFQACCVYSSHVQNLSGLTPGTLYHYRVTSVDAFGQSASSGDLTFTTSSGTYSVGLGTITPASPTVAPLGSQVFSISATGGPTNTVNWTATGGSFSPTTTASGATTTWTAPSGAGPYTITATAVDDGSKTATTTATVGSVPTGTSVKSSPYNAYGDGVHDDTAAINACISAVNAAGGGTVIVPAGTYMINALANSWYGVRVLSNVNLYLSAGAILQCITNSADNYAVVNLSGNNASVTGPGTISGDRATHTGTTGEWGMCLYVGNTTCTNATISGITCQNGWGDGIYVYETSSNTNLTITGVTCNYNRRQGMSIVQVNGLVCTGSTFSNTQGTAPECGIDIEPNSPATCTNININHNTFTGNHGGAFQCGAAAGTTITYVTFDSNTLTGNGVATRIAGDSGQANAIFIGYCYGQTSLTNALKITNNTLTNNYGEGIQFDHTTWGTCTGNTITGTINVSSAYEQGGGIYLFDSDYITVTGNTITGNAGPGVWFVGAASTDTHNTITPNTFSGNGGANYPSPTY